MYRILIADDEDLIRTLIREMIEMVDLPDGRTIDILEASNGEEAYEVLHKEQFDLLITDLNMPKLEGNDLIGKLTLNREVLPKHIIVVSGLISISEEDRKIDNVYFFSKPFTDELYPVLEELIGQA